MDQRMSLLLESITEQLERINKMVRTQAAKTAQSINRLMDALEDVREMLEMGYDTQTVVDKINEIIVDAESRED